MKTLIGYDSESHSLLDNKHPAKKRWMNIESEGCRVHGYIQWRERITHCQVSVKYSCYSWESTFSRASCDQPTSQNQSSSRQTSFKESVTPAGMDDDDISLWEQPGL